MDEEKVINKRIFGFAVGFFAVLALACLSFYAECIGLGIALVVLATGQIAVLFITPRCYVFSREGLVIKYFFGLQENIVWHNVRAILPHSEKVFRYTVLDAYKFIYCSEEKSLFFMQGIVSKNKRTKKLLQKYCPKKFDW